jgi:tartrate-resistant acid phosphatase type 5
MRRLRFLRLTCLAPCLLAGLLAPSGCTSCGTTPPALRERSPTPRQAEPAPQIRLPEGIQDRPSLRFAVIGDYGRDSEAEAGVARLVSGWNPDFIITTGDNNYPYGAAETIDANIGKHFAAFIGNYRGQYGAGSLVNRFWPSPGNHDWLAGLVPYLEYFTLPGNERYYDVDYGLVHLYALDSDPHEPDGHTADSAQAAWLQKRLAASTACYDLVYFHHPPYSSSRHGSTPTMRWPFEAWGAEAVLAGHDHSYERFAIGGIPYLVVGLGGAPEYEFNDFLPESLTHFNERHGALLVEATARGLVFAFYTADGKRIDEFTFTRPCHRNPSPH